MRSYRKDQNVPELKIEHFQPDMPTFSDFSLLAVLFFTDREIGHLALRLVGKLDKLTRGVRILALKRDYPLRSVRFSHECCFAFYFFSYMYCFNEIPEMESNYERLRFMECPNEQHRKMLSLLEHYARMWLSVVEDFAKHVEIAKPDKWSKMELKWAMVCSRREAYEQFFWEDDV